MLMPLGSAGQAKNRPHLGLTKLYINTLLMKGTVNVDALYLYSVKVALHVHYADVVLRDTVSLYRSRIIDSVDSARLHRQSNR
jgi:hypothetical protein